MLILCLDKCIIFTGDYSEVPLVENILSHMQYSAFSVAGKISLNEFAALIKNSEIFISSNTGPMHIAASMRTPVVAIFGPTDYKVNAPSSKNRHIITRKDLPCSPCRDFTCASRACMKSIDCEEVLQAAIKILNLQPVS